MPEPREPFLPRWLLWFTGVIAVIVLAGSLIPSPYVIERPGPVANTIGEVQIGEKSVSMITITGTKTYPTTGTLNLLTVTIVGNPENTPTWFDLLAAAIDPTQEILPMEQFYPSGVTTDDRSKENKVEMTSSQDAATAAALNELGIPFTQTLSVAAISETGPAQGILENGDVLVAVNGAPVTSYAALRQSIEANGTDTPASVTVLRDGEELMLEVTPQRVTQNSESAVLIGVQVATEYTFPFDVNIRVDQIGGPSAGLMFALGITDRLSGANFANNLVVSGTGTIDAEGNVGAIGGLPQKIVSAERAGSSVVFIPSDQCAEVPRNVSASLRIVPVATLGEAVDALEAVQEDGEKASLPSCAFGSSAASAQ